MKRVISTRVGEQKLIDQGYEYYGYEYEGDAQREQQKLESQGYQVKLLRETSDTVGLKMYSVWIKSL